MTKRIHDMEAIDKQAAIDEQEALRRMRVNIGLALRFVEGVDYEAFCSDDKTFYAAARCVEIIYDATEMVHSVEWPRQPDWLDEADADMRDMRDDSIFFAREHALWVWRIIHEVLPALAAHIDAGLEVSPSEAAVFRSHNLRD
jgi:uncharacterized protein with HEPN domain